MAALSGEGEQAGVEGWVERTFSQHRNGPMRRGVGSGKWREGSTSVLEVIVELLN